MSNSALLGGCATALCLSVVWPYCFQKQWGINGLPCFRGAQIDCGWVDENDYEFLGIEDEHSRREAEERKARMAWANKIVAHREQQRLRTAMGRRIDGLKSHLVLGPQGNIHFHPSSSSSHNPRGKNAATLVDTGVKKRSGAVGSETVEEMTPTKRKSLALGLGAENLDDLVGGRRMRRHKAHGGNDDGGVVAAQHSREWEHNSVGTSVQGGTTHPVVVVENGSEATPLNRGVIARQTFVPPNDFRSRQYHGTEPMTLNVPASNR